MLKRLLLLALLISTPAWASHIVGGEFELLHVAGNIYQLNMNLYFDVINGNPGARDPQADVRIYSKSDNTRIMDVTLPFVSQSKVEYFQPDCSNGEIITDKLIYSASITLDSDVFNDPAGYYIVWERCCRNYTITNIISNDPSTGGQYAGQTFYLEFPPVVKNGEEFINSSPQLFPPLNDYACPNRPYWVDFAGYDADGDSLAYSLVTPLSTHTGEAIPAGGPRPAPFPTVTWQSPFSLSNIMNGHPDLQVSDEGFLTVTPSQQGLYVFAVKCEEYRDGEKIGEVIRDFQMLVLGSCPVADPPLIEGKKLTDADFSYVDNMYLTFDNTVPDEDRCVQVRVSDPDASKAEDNFTEQIWLRVIPLNFKTDKNLNDLLPETSRVTLQNGSTEIFDVCFDKCPYIENGPFKIGVVAFDDACALPLSDTLRIELSIVPPYNTPPYFVTSDVTISIKEGVDYLLNIEGRDNDNDELSLEVLTDDFNLEDVGMSFVNETLENGLATTTFQWQTGCDIYDFTERTEFQVKVLLDDLDECNFNEPDTLTLNLQVILPPNTDPVISTDLPQTELAHTLETPLEFNVFGLDTDGDEIVMTVVGDGFNLQDYEMSFPEETTGISNVQAHFSWDTQCDLFDLESKNEFKLYFLLNDYDKCKFTNTDSLEVTIHMVPPFNSAPQISFDNLNPSVLFADRAADITIGEFLDLQVMASDDPKDSVWLELLSVNGEEDFQSFQFENAKGKGAIQSELRWDPACSDLAEAFSPKDYHLMFRTYDNKCANPKSDTVEITLSAKDVEQLIAKFTPANIFTPNNDGTNDYYSLLNLPLDNCLGRFLSFKVHNRWGTEVYTTTNRDFKWYAEGLSSGVYYYSVKFSNKDYNGTITILY
ncbi:MAG: gliding motility-associated C-terminal domain-containing protein [Cyclobacteriaceae bacterium]|nr:gliding motility-associated C-terminal domain-containing protein [Cyclobacteriaceae bacterium]